MPVYEYLDVETGEKVDLVRSVAGRDRVPPNYKRVTVPQRIAIHGTSSSPLEPGCPEASVPRAYKKLEEKVDAREIVKESGFSIEEVKEVWGI